MRRRRFLGMAAGGLGSLWVGCGSMRHVPSGPVRFGAVADVQYKDAPPWGSRHYRASVDKLRECVAALNAADLDFAIHLGDFIDADWRSFDEVCPLFERLNCPGYHVLGNHDYAVAQQEKARVPDRLGMPGCYYQFRMPGWRFIVADGNDVSLRTTDPDTPERRVAEEYLAQVEARNAPNAMTWNGAIGPGQMAWLERQLTDAGRCGERALLFCHFPVYPVNAHNLWDDQDVLAMIDRHPCVAAYLNGHNHAGAYAERHGVHFVTLRGMVETADSPAYAIVTCNTHDGLIHIDGRGREPDRELQIR